MSVVEDQGIFIAGQQQPPRRIAVSGDGFVWYRDYARGRLGRLDPKTGKVTEYPSPGGAQSQPYAITALKGMVWYVETNVQPNALVRFDPATEKFQTWPIPSGGGVVRNMMPTRDGNLALACSGVNGVALGADQERRRRIKSPQSPRMNLY